jgi:uroporphyrinogen decarboxylase
MEAEEMQQMMEEGIRGRTLHAGEAVAGGMTLRERYRAAMFYRVCDKLPNFEFGYWRETLKEWHGQGLPGTISNQKDAYDFFGIENWGGAGGHVGMLPGFDEEVIEETGEYITTRDDEGAVKQINKTGHQSIPHYLDFGLKTREDWEKDYKWRFDPDAPGRVPEDWPRRAAELRDRTYPLCVGIGSMIGRPRNWIGFENIAMMVYDDPGLLEEIVQTQCNLVCGVLEKVLPYLEFDFAAGWEDICFNSGPIVGERFMREVVGPRYARIAEVCHKHGVFILNTDCDGNLEPISDVFVGNGYNCFFPVEVHAGTDPVALREKHGTAARFQGGFCKMKFLEGPQAIEDELQRLLPVVQEGGFIPGVDHRVQADAPLANYMYYLKRKRELFDAGGTPQYDEEKVGLKRDGTVEIPKL